MCDLILFNANVITMNPALSAAELVAAGQGRITAIARNEMLGKIKRPGTRIIDCRKQTVLPGFVDAHCHIRAYAESLVTLNLSPQGGVRSISDIQNKIGDCCRTQPPGTWVRGKRYNEFYLAEKRHPNRWDIDAAAPDYPVKITHRSGHAHVLNSLALKYAGISAETEDPPEGLIDRDPGSGEPTGILYGLGSYLAEKIPSLDDAAMNRGMASANEKLLSFGITSVQDASYANDLRQWKWFEAIKAQAALQPRITMMMGWNAFAESQYLSLPPARTAADLELGGVKIVTGCATGELYPGREELNRRISAINNAGLQAVIHAIEEPEIEASCDAVARALAQHPRHDHRHRIDHCSVCPPSLQRRLAALGIVVATQPSFIYFSGDRYLKTVPGDQLEHLYPIGSLVRSGVHIASGSDCPIADPNPMVSIGAAVTRISEGGASVLPQQRVDISDALAMHTIGAAYSGFQEDSRGSINIGKLADLVVLNADPFSVEANEIKDIKVIMTVLNGEVVWQNPSA